jgi:hypothetical protein
LTLDSRDDYYWKAIDFIVDRCVAASQRKDRRKRWSVELEEGGEAALKAQMEFRIALHEYYGPRLRPVRINTTTAVVLLDRSGSWLLDNKSRLGYDKSQGWERLYDYDCVCAIGRTYPPVPGALVTVVVAGEKLVGTYLGMFGFASLNDALSSGARLREMTMEKALSMPWSDLREKEIWGKSYIRAITRLIEQSPRGDSHN